MIQYFTRALTVSAALTLVACSSGSGGGTTPTNNPPPTAGLQVSGAWQIRETVTSASGVCAGERGQVDNYGIAVIQNGSALTVTTPAGQFSGSMSGDRISWTGSFAEQGGTTTITRMDLIATSNSLSGSTDWTWSDGEDSCTGSTSVTGSRSIGNLEARLGELEIVHDGLVDGAEFAVLFAEPGHSDGLLLGGLEDDARFVMAPGIWDVWVVQREAYAADRAEDLPRLREFLNVELRAGERTVVFVELGK